MSSIIISGFPAIGKSSISDKFDFLVWQKHCTTLDLESSCFFVNGARPENWEKMYINVLEHIKSQAYIPDFIFVSSHKSVREEMIKRGIKFYSIFPAINMKEAWRKRLEERYKKDPTEKNKRAMEYIMANYENSIEDMKSDPNPVEVTFNEDERFDLFDVLRGLKEYHEI